MSKKVMYVNKVCIKCFEFTCMTILIAEPVLIVICRCFCSRMDMHLPFVPSQPKTGSSMVPMM